MKFLGLLLKKKKTNLSHFDELFQPFISVLIEACPHWGSSPAFDLGGQW